MICSLPGSSVHGILQARILEWIAMPSSSRASRPRDGTWVSCIAGGFFITEPRGKPQGRVYNLSNPTLDLQSSPYLISVQSLTPVTIQAECAQKVNASTPPLFPATHYCTSHEAKHLTKQPHLHKGSDLNP